MQSPLSAGIAEFTVSATKTMDIVSHHVRNAIAAFRCVEILHIDPAMRCFSSTHSCAAFFLPAPGPPSDPVPFSKEGLGFREARGAARYGALAVGVGLWCVAPPRPPSRPLAPPLARRARILRFRSRVFHLWFYDLRLPDAHSVSQADAPSRRELHSEAGKLSRPAPLHFAFAPASLS